MSDIPVETRVKVWPGAREGRSRPAITLTERGPWLGGVEVYRIQYLDTGGFDYIAATHIEPERLTREGAEDG